MERTPSTRAWLKWLAESGTQGRTDEQKEAFLAGFAAHDARQRFGGELDRAEHMIHASRMAAELGMTWGLLGTEHDFAALLVYLDARTEKKNALVPEGFLIHDDVITAWPSVAYSVSTGEPTKRHPGIPAGATATVTTTPHARHTPVRFIVDGSCSHWFTIRQLNAGVESLIQGRNGGPDGGISASVFLPEASPAVALRPVLMEVGMDFSVTMTNISNEGRPFRAAVIGIQQANPWLEHEQNICGMPTATSTCGRPWGHGGPHMPRSAAPS